MNELTKVKRVMQKLLQRLLYDVLVVLDGSTGQNAFEQAKQFTAATEDYCIAVTKLDGTARWCCCWSQISLKFLLKIYRVGEELKICRF
jgi:signal recognition particle GTPase